MQEDRKSLLSAFSTAATIGVTMVACIAVGFGLGYLLDKVFDTGSAMSIVGIILGMVAGLWSIFKAIVKSS